MVMIMVMVVMRFLCSCTGWHWPYLELLICKWIARQRNASSGRTLLILRNSKSWFLRLADGNPAHAAELIPAAIVISTQAANDCRGTARKFPCGAVRSLLRVGFGSQTLCGL